jgi:uncharacterized protein (DUF427 family)
MAVELGGVLNAAMGELRMQPVEWRVRARLRDFTVVDSRAARLVWEPRRVVSAYAVPVEDVAGRLVPSSPDGGRVDPDISALPPVLSPRHPFALHSTAGTAYDLATDAGTLAAAAFTPDDADLQGYAVLDWDAFTAWSEEDEEAVDHPREPHHRVRCLPSSRHVVVSLGGEILADTHRPVLLVETSLPPRWYLPREDVRMDLLTPSQTHTVCAYKGVASYLDAEGAHDVAWFYPDPLPDALLVRDLVCFWQPAVVHVDGTPVSTSMPGG